VDNEEGIGMERERHLELLRTCPYFAQLSDELLQSVLGVVTVRQYEPGEAIFFEGDEAGNAALHIVESGVVRIFKVSLEGREQVLRLMREGDSFADVPAFDGGPYPANADALEASTVLRIPRQPLMALMQEHPDIALGALSNMASRLRHMTGLVEDLSLRRVMSRVAHLLQENQGNANLTQSQMATMVGTAREMVNRSLNTLADRGIIELRGPEIVITDPERLGEIVESG
jgi:CRP-like cAMP-binding protein